MWYDVFIYGTAAEARSAARPDQVIVYNKAAGRFAVRSRDSYGGIAIAFNSDGGQEDFVVDPQPGDTRKERQFTAA